jgi:hypothetical protein
MMADWTDSAEPLNNDRDFPKKPSANEPLEPAKLDDVETRLVDLTVPVEMDRDLPMTFDPRHG